MRARSIVFALVAAGCSRGTETSQPRAHAEPARDAAVEAAAAAPSDAGELSFTAPPAGPFTIVARTQTNLSVQYGRGIGSAMALVQRLPGGGLVVASEYARARADGPGALAVEVIGGGMEDEALNRPHMVQGMEGMRWVWSDAALAIVTNETETARTGPRLISYKVGAAGFQVLRRSVGYWSAAARDGSVLALERTAYEIPNSSMYPKGSEYEANDWGLKPARVAVLSGTAAAPVIPAGVCPTAMSAATDGTVVIAVEKCNATDDQSVVGVLRYARAATQAKVEWFTPRSTKGRTAVDVTTFAASASEIYVADGPQLHTWNGKVWSSDDPFRQDNVTSISRAPNGELWAVVGDRVMKRSAEGDTWSRVLLPNAPADRLDDEAFSPPTFEVSHFVKGTEVSKEFAIRPNGSTDVMSALTVDATGDDVIVLAVVDHEGFVLSTKPRTPAARLPSIVAQRARLARSVKRRVAASPKQCESYSFLVFPETTTVDAVRAALGDAAKIGEGVVEGQKRFFVYTEKDGVTAAAKRLSALGPKRLCGPAVIDREL